MTQDIAALRNVENGSHTSYRCLSPSPSLIKVSRIGSCSQVEHTRTGLTSSRQSSAQHKQPPNSTHPETANK